MIARARTAVALAAWIACTLAGCSDGPAIRWEASFVEPALAMRAQVLEIEILEGGCEGTRAVHSAERTRSGSMPRVPRLASGTYGFRIVARDVDCVRFARGCTPVTLPQPDGTTVRTEIAALFSEELACDVCSGGLCNPPPDDGGTPDGDAGEPPSDGGLRPEAPLPFSPWNGVATGSPHAPLRASGTSPLRPLFRWSASPGAIRYEIQLDDSCLIDDFLACPFPSPLFEADLTTTSYVPPSDLPRDSASPSGGRVAGSRVFWRVRACSSSSDLSCSAFSRTRWIDAGRLDADFDGDGRAELPIGSPARNDVAVDQGVLFVYADPGAGDLALAQTIAHPGNVAGAWFASALAAGDIDGDGYADLVVGSEGVDVGGQTNAGEAYVLFGGIGGLDAARRVRLRPEAPEANGYFGHVVAVIGDVDEDGRRDVLVGSARSEPDSGAPVRDGAAFLFAGGAPATMATSPARVLVEPEVDPGAQFGWSIAGVGDVDGDGHPDALIGAAYRDVAGAPNVGRAYLYHGGPSTPARATDRGLAVAPYVIESPHPDEAQYFAFALAGGNDLDGDGYADFAIGAPYDDYLSSFDDRGFVAVYRGGPSAAPALDGDLVRHSPAAQGDYAHVGWTIASGDLDYDGLADLVVGQVGADTRGLTDNGVVAVYRGTEGGLSRTVAAELDIAGSGNMELGRSLAVLDTDGSGRGELVAGAHQFRVVYTDGTFAEYVGRVYVWPDDALGAPPQTIAPVSVETRGRFGYSLPGTAGRRSDAISNDPE